MHFPILPQILTDLLLKFKTRKWPPQKKKPTFNTSKNSYTPKRSHFHILQKDFMNLILSFSVCAPIPMWRINKWSALQGLGESAVLFSFMMWYFPQKSVRRQHPAACDVREGEGEDRPVSSAPHFTSEPKRNSISRLLLSARDRYRERCCLTMPIKPHSAQIWALIHGKREWETNMNQVGRNTCTNEKLEVIDSVCCTVWIKTHGPAHCKCAGLSVFESMYADGAIHSQIYSECKKKPLIKCLCALSHRVQSLFTVAVLTNQSDACIPS